MSELSFKEERHKAIKEGMEAAYAQGVENAESRAVRRITELEAEVKQMREADEKKEGEAVSAYRKLLTKIKALTEMLMVLEWKNGRCRFCENDYDEVHLPNCRLAALLEGSK